MTNYWAIAPWPSDEPQAFATVWRYDRTQGCIAIGWEAIGDPSRLIRQELRNRVRATCPDFPGGEQALWDFYHNVQVGDVVFAKRGRKYCIGIGRVIGRATFDLERGSERLGVPAAKTRSNFCAIRWERLDEILLEKQRWLPRRTISRVDGSKYLDLLSA